MTFSVEDWRADNAERQRQAEINRQQADLEHKRWARRFVVKAVAGFAAAFVGGAALLALVLHLVGKL